MVPFSMISSDPNLDFKVTERWLPPAVLYAQLPRDLFATAKVLVFRFYDIVLYFERLVSFTYFSLIITNDYAN